MDDAVFRRAGCRGWLCALEVDGPGEVALDADEPVVAASVVKVTVALELFRQAAAGRVRLAERVELVPPGTPGSAGFSTFADPVTVSLRDLARMMLAVSDNAATDALLDRVGVAAVNATTAALGLAGTAMVGSLAEIVDSIGRDLGFAGWRELQRAAAASAEEDARLRGRLPAVSALDPARTARTTARDMATLLRLVWRDAAGPAAACAPVRELMAAQVTRHRLATGFPFGVRVSAKSGTLMGVVRNEVGVVEYPDGARYAVAVFTRADEPYRREHEIDRAIGAAAAEAVEELRSG